MSILIKSMEKPENCQPCIFNMADCRCWITHGEIDRHDYSCDVDCLIVDVSTPTEGGQENVVDEEFIRLAEAIDEEIMDSYCKIQSIIKSLPSAEPERMKGEWIYGENDGQDGWYCSECNGFIPWDYDFYGLDNIDFIMDYKTCPFCDAKMITYTGANMRGEKNDGYRNASNIICS